MERAFDLSRNKTVGQDNRYNQESSYRDLACGFVGAFQEQMGRYDPSRHKGGWSNDRGDALNQAVQASKLTRRDIA